MTDLHPWLRAYPDHVSWKAEFPAVPSPLRTIPCRFPSTNAWTSGKTYTYAALGSLVERAAAGFRSLGVDKGVKVGLFLPNCPQFVIAYFGVLRAGGTVVNYSPLYAEEDLLRQIEDSDTTIMVTLSLKALYPKMASALQKSRVQKLVSH